MELRQLQHFLAVLDTGSFHGAAARVNLTQQAISRSIKKLEEELGVTLLERKARARHKVVATGPGRILMPRAQGMLAEASAFRTEVKDYIGTGRDVVHVGATPAEAGVLIPRACAAFAKSQPATRVQVIEHQGTKLFADVASGQYDLAICSEPKDDIDQFFATEKLVSNENIFVVRPSHPLAQRSKLKLAEMTDFAWVALGLFEHTMYEFIRIFSAAQLEHPFHAVETTSVELGMRSLKDNDYIAFLPHLLVHDELASESLCRLNVRKPAKVQWSSLMVSRACSPLNRTMTAFRDTVRDVARDFRN